MKSDNVLQQLRLFLLGLAGFLFAGTLTELVFLNHTTQPIQFLPFVLCTAGIISVAAVLLRPDRSVLLVLRVVMVFVAVGGAFGATMHLFNNVSVRVQIHPDSSVLEIITAAVAGANPLLAPGILTIGALLALAATYYHQGLARTQA